MTSSFSVNSSVETLDPLLQDPTYAAAQLAQWQFNRTGGLALGAANHFGFIRIPDDSPIYKTADDPTAGPTSAHFEFVLTVS